MPEFFFHSTVSYDSKEWLLSIAYHPIGLYVMYSVKVDVSKTERS